MVAIANQNRSGCRRKPVVRNQVLDKIAEIRKTMQDGLDKGKITPETLDKLHETLSMNVVEFSCLIAVRNYSLKSGLLTQDEFQTIKMLMGPTEKHFNERPLEEKAAFTEILKDLLQIKIAVSLAQ